MFARSKFPSFVRGLTSRQSNRLEYVDNENETLMPTRWKKKRRRPSILWWVVFGSNRTAHLDVCSMGFGCKVYTSARRLWEPRPGPREMPKPGLFPIDTQKRTGSTLSRISSFVSLARSTIFKTYPDGGIGCHRHSQSFRLYHQKERLSWQFSGILTVWMGSLPVAFVVCILGSYTMRK